MSTTVITNTEQDKVLDALGKVVLSNKHTRRLLAKQSIGFRAKYYRGRTLAEHQIRWADKLMSTKRGAIFAPCGHGKTAVASEDLPLHLIPENRNIRILLVSKSDGLAVKNLKVIKHELMNNARIIQDYGRFYDPGATWSDHQIYVMRDKNLKDPTVEAVGLLGAITGGRFDVIILDDVLDILNTRSDEQRAKIKDYIDGTLIPRLEPWGVCWAIGTRKHYDDYYAKILRDKTWITVHERAIIREPKDWHIEELDDPVMMDDGMGGEVEVYVRAVIDSKDRGECLWPGRWGMESLLILRYSIGTLVFNREYQNTMLSEEDAIFKLKDLEPCCDENLSYVEGDFDEQGLRPHYKFVVQGTDPALIDDKKKAELKDSDYTVIITIGVTHQGNEELLGMFRKRGLSPKQIEDESFAEYNRFLPYCMFWESNNFGTIHARNLIDNKGMKLVKHHTDRRKHDLYTGVPSLSVKFENKKFRLPYKTPEDKAKTDIFIAEFHGLGMEKHDDIVMATWICSTGIDRIRKGQARVSRPRTNLKRVEKVRRI